MVQSAPYAEGNLSNFQYSLCRVVLMVAISEKWTAILALLSVLALSSRFDGRGSTRSKRLWQTLSVLALSSRFDGRV